MPDDQPVRKKHHLPRDCYRGGDAFFITICTHEKKQILIEPPVKDCLIDFLEGQKDIAGGPVHAYVIMPDHLHMLVSGQKDLIEWIRWFKARVSFFVKRRGFSEKIWQKSAYDEGIRKPEKVMEILAYMADNPVEKELVARREDWQLKYGC
ncbi:MAG: transposase [Myxococcota bacterium]|jgi:putative transposase